MISNSTRGIIVVRADACHVVGSGHVMRCLALAQAWRFFKHGQVIFFGNITDKGIKARIQREGFTLIKASRPYPNPADADAMGKLLAAQDTKLEHWCVVDGYHFKKDYIRLLRRQGWKVLRFDDYHHLEQYEADIILNQNLDAEKINYKSAPWTLLLLGGHFAQLRQEFLAYSPNYDQPQTAHRILLTFGGSDPSGLTSRAMNAIAALDCRDLEIKVVIGQTNKETDLITKSASQMPFPCEICQAVDDMAPLFSWADLALGTAGSTCWEMAYFGIPMILIIAAENQKLVAAGLARRGAAINLGSGQKLRSGVLTKTTQNLIFDQDKRRSMAETARSLIDGRGALRVVERLAKDKLLLRPVTERDCRLIFQWANEEKVRDSSFTSKTITWPEHRRWFSEISRQPYHMFFIGVNASNNNIGQLRFDVHGHEAEVSISLAPQFRGFGYGRQLLNLGIDKAWRRTGIHLIRARIKADNKNSLRLFSQAGFRAGSQKIKVKGVAAIEMTLKRTNNNG